MSHVSLLEAHGIWLTDISQILKCFEIHPSVGETTEQQHPEVSSVVLSYTICKTHLSFIETTSYEPAFAKFLRWLG